VPAWAGGAAVSNPACRDSESAKLRARSARPFYRRRDGSARRVIPEQGKAEASISHSFSVAATAHGCGETTKPCKPSATEAPGRETGRGLFCAFLQEPLAYPAAAAVCFLLVPVRRK
jgi:hypothetical protein